MSKAASHSQTVLHIRPAPLSLPVLSNLLFPFSLSFPSYSLFTCMSHVCPTVLRLIRRRIKTAPGMYRLLQMLFHGHLRDIWISIILIVNPSRQYLCCFSIRTCNVHNYFICHAISFISLFYSTVIWYFFIICPISSSAYSIVYPSVRWNSNALSGSRL